MKTIALGSQGLTVTVEGLGAMGMSAFYGARDDEESAATPNRAELVVAGFRTRRQPPPRQCRRTNRKRLSLAYPPM